MNAVSASPVVLITGAARRIGARIARHLHARGARVLLHFHHSQDDAVALMEELEAQRRDSVGLVKADLADIDGLGDLVATGIARFGRLDGLVNNASAFFATPLAGVTPGQWDTLMTVNAKAPFFLAKAVAPHLRASGGAIVNLTDIYAQRPLRNHSAYCMTKAALVMGTQALALELGPHVRVNAVAPGNVLWSDNPVKAETLETVCSRTALQRQGAPDDIASAVHWLLFENAYITGQTVNVDGGRTLFI